MKSSPAPTPTTIRPLAPGMQRMLLIASGLVFIVGIQLFLLPTATERFFAWTVNPPFTAAFMGAAYWSSCVLELMAAREKTWARARIAVPAVLIFTTLTFIATLIHIDRFHLDTNSFAFYTVGLTWVWIAVYAIVPLAMAVLLVRQFGQAGGDPPRQALLPAWMRGLLVLQGAVMLLPGLILFFSPSMLIDTWPWTLTVVTGRVIGAWLIGLGIAALHMAWENSATRVYASLLSMITFVVLQAIALLRFPGDILWGTVQTWVYLIFLASLLLVGIAGVLQARGVSRGM